MATELLVCLEGSPSTARAIELAISLAQELGSLLTGLAIVDEPDIHSPETTGTFGSSFKHDRDETLLADARAQAKAWGEDFLARCVQAKVTARIEALEGEPAATILDQLAKYDLTLLGRHTNFRFETETSDRRTQRIVLHRAGRPVLLVPDMPLEASRSVLLAYDGSSAARRALTSFVESGLAHSRALHVACVDDEGERGFQTASEGCALLKDLGFHAQAHSIVSALSPAHAIIQRRRQLRAGMVVAGAYTRSRFLHFIRGSVTQELVEHCDVPLMLRR